MKVAVCIGSACHIKGSRYIVEQLQGLIRSRDLNDQIELSGRFCMGNCRNGVCVTVDDELYSVSPNTVREFFESTILPRLEIC